MQPGTETGKLKTGSTLVMSELRLSVQRASTWPVCACLMPSVLVLVTVPVPVPVLAQQAQVLLIAQCRSPPSAQPAVAVRSPAVRISNKSEVGSRWSRVPQPAARSRSAHQPLLRCSML
jgi:hypothetical protein